MHLQSTSPGRLVGRRLGGYRVEQLLGYGSVNAVYSARRETLDQALMLTAFLVPETLPLESRERFRIRFNQVATKLTELEHPHLLPVYAFGEEDAIPYIITPLITTGSLAKVLKQQTRLAPQEITVYLQQIASGLDYAHRHGIKHGTLKPANIVLDSKRQVQITGLGFGRILELRDIARVNHPYAHLFSISGSFLGSPEYIAPEVVQGEPVSALSDVYTVGAMLFELLSGVPPFTGSDPLATALLHIQRPVPSLQAACPDLPPALDLVLQRALEPDVQQRYPTVGRLADGFERVLKVIEVAQRQTSSQPVPASSYTSKGQRGAGWQPAPTLPPEHDWFEEELAANAQWLAEKSRPTENEQRLSSPRSVQNVAPVLPVDSPEEMSIDPFVWWSTTSMKAIDRESSAISDTSGEHLATGGVAREQGVDKKRRRMVALLATGGAAAVLALGAGGISLFQMVQAQQQNRGIQANRALTPQATETTQAATATPTQQPSPTPTPKPSPTAKPSPTPTAKPSPTPTPRPSPTPKPSPTPSHTGTVIGSTSMGNNSSKTFTNPANGKKSILVRLPDGNFVAYESACPHEYVDVYYDGGSHRFVCPAHNAIFDPVNNGYPTQGPTNRPLPKVTIRVNGDGTITTG
jgi:serine/threonine protein kinase